MDRVFARSLPLFCHLERHNILCDRNVRQIKTHEESQLATLGRITNSRYTIRIQKRSADIQMCRVDHMAQCFAHLEAVIVGYELVAYADSDVFSL